MGKVIGAAGYPYRSMDEDMIMEIPNRSVFTPAALKRWDEIDLTMQGNLLGNVWCGNCRKAVHILVRSANIEDGNLILRGLCAQCNKDVARLIEKD